MTTNPITGQSTLTFRQMGMAEKAEKGQAAGKALNDAGHIGLNTRVRGHWKVGAYSVFNVLSLGILGQIGAYCARSSVMSPTNPDNQTSAWNRMWQDVGQTHLNATQDTGRVMNSFNKFVTHVVGFIPGHALGIGFALDVKMADPGAQHVDRYKRNISDNVMNANGIKHKGVGDLGNIRNAGKPVWTRVAKEIGQIEKASGPKGDLIRAAMIDGSDELQAAWDNHLKDELSHENALFYRWTQPIEDKMDPASPKHVPNHQLSKFELAVAYSDFVSQGSPHEVNLSYSTRRDAVGGLHTALGDEYIQKVKTLRGKVQRAERDFQQAQTKAPRSPETIRKFRELQALKQQVTDLRNADDDKLSPQASQAVFGVLKPAHRQIAQLMKDSADRFKNKVAANDVVSRGYDTEVIGHNKRLIERKAHDLRSKLQQAGVPRERAEILSKETFAPFDKLSVRQWGGVSKLKSTQEDVDAEAKKLLGQAQAWKKGLDARVDKARQAMADKGVPPAKIEDNLKAWFGHAQANFPETQRGVEAQFKQLDDRFQSTFQMMTSELDTEPPAELDRTGQQVDIPFDTPAKDYMTDDANTYLADKLSKPNDRDWTTTDNTANEGVFGSFLRDCSRTKFVVNGVTISDPSDKTRTPQQQMDECKAKLLEAGVPEDDIPILTAALHQGIGGGMQTMASDPTTKDIAPSHLLFSHDSDNKKAGDGVEISITGKDDGTYDFSFGLKNPMSSVMDGANPMARPFMTDPTKSRNEISLSGNLDPNAKNKDWVTVTDASYSYNAVPQAKAHQVN